MDDIRHRDGRIESAEDLGVGRVGDRLRVHVGRLDGRGDQPTPVAHEKDLDLPAGQLLLRLEGVEFPG